MLSEVLLVSIIGIILGLIIIYLIGKKVNIEDKVTATGRAKQKIIKNPDILLSKLKEGNNGRLFRDGKDQLDYSVVEENGKKRLDLKRTPYKDPTEEKPIEKKPIIKVSRSHKKKDGKK